MALPGKHVLIIVENLPVPFDRRVWMEATSLRSRGFEVSVISPIGKGFDASYEVLDGIHVYRHRLPAELSSIRGYLREYSAALIWEWRLARRAWRRKPIDVIHICNPPDLIFLVAAWFKAWQGVRVIYDQHDLNPEMYEAKYNRRDIFYRALRVAEKLTYGLADVVIATNESHREVAIQRGKFDPSRVFIVRSGPDLSRFRAVPPNSSKKKGRRYLVGYVGVMGEPEGIDVLLHAVHYIVTTLDRHDIAFVLVGAGPSLTGLTQLRDSLGLTNVVEFTGRVPDKEMIEILSAADVCVAPDVKSPYNDCCTMNKVLEYMALGKPIVQFDLVEGRRSAGPAAVYARDNDPRDFAQKIIELLDNPLQRQVMGEAGLTRMESNLEWRHQVPALNAAYATALSGR